MKQVSIYLQNAHLTPSSYYRLTQYFLGSGARLHSALPNGVYTWWHSRSKKGKLLMKVFLYLFYVVRTLVSLFHDVMTLHGGTVIISKVVVPHHLPLLHRCLIKILSRRNQLIWDFDDNMLETRTISKADFNFMVRTSHKIVVTNSFLMSSRLRALNTSCATATMTQSASRTSSSAVSVTPYSLIASRSEAQGSTTAGVMP